MNTYEKSEVNNKHKHKDGKFKTILSIWYFNQNRFPDKILTKHKARLYAHGGMKLWGVNYWESYATLVNGISVRSLLYIVSINELPIIPMEFLLAFPKSDPDVDVLM